jgi:hypothetical protein
MHTFSIREAVKFAWGAVKRNLGFFIVLSVFLLVVSFGTEILDEFQPMGESNAMVSFLYVFLFAMNLILAIWVVRVGIDAVSNNSLSFSSLVPSWEIVWKFVLSNILVALIIFIPALLLSLVVVMLGVGVVFGGLMLTVTFDLAILQALLLLLLLALVYLGARFMFASYYVVDKKLGPIESVKASWHLSRGRVWKLIALTFVLGFISVAGVLALFIGLLITIPISIVAQAFVYRALVGSPDSVPTPAGDYVEPVPTPTIQK